MCIDYIFRLTLVACLATGILNFRMLLVPLPGGSHLSWMMDVGVYLATRGHEVDILAPDIPTFRKYDIQSKVNIVYYQSKFGPTFEETVKMGSNYMVQGAWKGSSTGILDLLYQVYAAQDSWIKFTRELFMNNKHVLTRLEERRYDLAIMDGAPSTYCFYVIPYKLGIPYVSITTGYDASNTGIPALPSFVPSQVTTYSHQMSFLQRLDNFVAPDFGTLRFFAPNGLVTEFVPEKPYISLLDLRRKSLLFFIDLATPLDYPRPTLPQVIMLPGLTVKQAKKIEDVELAKFVDEAEEGFIFFSLGTFIMSFPLEMTDIFLSAFRQIPQRVVFRYKGAKLDEVPRNVKLVTWVPQNDLLGHRNCKLFITHCGNNGQFESLYHGVPMLGLPLFADQPYNAHRMEANGYGISLRLSTLTTESMVAAITNLATDPRYAQKARLASGILKDDPMMPLDKVAYWVEHVIKFGNDHLRSPAVDMPWYQYWMLDIMLFLVIILVIIIVSTWYMLKLLWTCLSGLWAKEKIE